MQLLCLDAGSSSLKFAEYRVSEDAAHIACIRQGGMPAADDADAAFGDVLARTQWNLPANFVAVGHRIVFGGPRHFAPTIADDAVLADLEELACVDPLHLRPQLDLIYAARRRFPSILQVLCFDTAFHRNAPAIAKRLPLPNDLDPLIARYGFHGLSYEYIVSQLPRDCGRTVVAHLGSGASLCALRDGSPVDTTMGFSALGGVMMSTRPGDLDPGVLLRLLADGYDLQALTDLLYRRSGLLGVSGRYAEMKELLARSGVDPAAREAVELFTYQLVKHLGAMTAVIGGLDTLVFTGGIGENASAIRARVCVPFEYLGLRVDEAANQGDEVVISEPSSRVAVMVVPTDETLVIARHTAALRRDSIEKVL